MPEGREGRWGPLKDPSLTAFAEALPTHPGNRHVVNSEDLERLKLQKAGSLHWFHWVIVGLSLALTLGVWLFSRNQVHEKHRRRFETESNRVVDHVEERMRKYEDALWAGVALMDTVGGDLKHQSWTDYTKSLHIETKYPGVSGIGVIHSIQPDEVSGYLANQHLERPSFKIHPEHSRGEYFPITFIEPESKNAAAIGLDIAHEDNRYTAARKAMETGLAHITGPIVLVQDAGNTPGFLFYAPFYPRQALPNGADTPLQSKGLVYAPFIFRELMKGTLSQDNRHVGIRISDQDAVLYDEHNADLENQDPDPLFKKAISVSMFGRKWSFDIRSDHSFRSAVHNSQPNSILFGGLIIDAMLIGLFVLISRANRKALAYADAATAELKAKAHDLEESNQELERFAYVASHDLREPLRMVGSFAELLQKEYATKFDERGTRWLGFMIDGANRMQDLIQGLLEYSRVARGEGPPSEADTQSLLKSILVDLSKAVEESRAVITSDELPMVLGHKQQLRMVLQNLVSNAIKFCPANREPEIHVGAEVEGSTCTLSVRDNGIGIEQQYVDRIYVIFQRLHTREEYPGTGIGLAISKKIVENQGGRLWFESAPGEGTTFYFTVPLAPQMPGAALPSGGRRSRFQSGAQLPDDHEERTHSHSSL